VPVPSTTTAVGRSANERVGGAERARRGRERRARRSRGRWQRQDLECRLDHDAERAERSDEQLVEVVPGHVLHDPPTGARDGPVRERGADPEQEVADASIAVAAEAVAVRRDDPADGRAARDVRRIDREELAVRRERVAERRDGHPSTDRDRQILGDVVDDAVEPAGLEHDVRHEPRTHVALRPTATHPHRAPGARARAQQLRARLGGARPLSARH
jgi:hypothetical protein